MTYELFLVKKISYKGKRPARLSTALKRRVIPSVREFAGSIPRSGKHFFIDICYSHLSRDMRKPVFGFMRNQRRRSVNR